ncbi:MAG: hypothetical protein ACYCVH_14845 [Ignavibacteriaceae bacterium]
MGQEVTTLLNNQAQSSGNHRIEFDANKYNLSSGIYFYELKLNKNHQVRKMMILK